MNLLLLIHFDKGNHCARESFKLSSKLSAQESCKEGKWQEDGVTRQHCFALHLNKPFPLNDYIQLQNGAIEYITKCNWNQETGCNQIKIFAIKLNRNPRTVEVLNFTFHSLAFLANEVHEFMNFYSSRIIIIKQSKAILSDDFEELND